MKKLIIARENVDDSYLPSDLHPVIKQIYATRNVQNAHELNNSAATLIDFKLFKDIDKATELLIDALNAQSRILIVGDKPHFNCWRLRCRWRNQYSHLNARLGNVWL